ncbi:MAG: EscN/YscN/HrcN family type III secretion system ATPase, partial [Planctomycetales bacterium]|nr:EscN/YscN/HrcN family type III secretion system ATPase [Planctomycetales bacterium]
GANVLFLLDSLTRLATAQRELGLSLGEPPSARGYPPSVFQMLSRTLEQLGNSSTGTITAILTVLVDGDDMNEPIADSVRSIVDGHITLTRQLAERGHFPAVDVSQSLSRVFREIAAPSHQKAAQAIRHILATHAEVADLLRVGAYVKGTSPQVDRAVDLLPTVNAVLTQPVDSRSTLPVTLDAMQRIAAQWPFVT